jgi:hypothetical protein
MTGSKPIDFLGGATLNQGIKLIMTRTLLLLLSILLVAIISPLNAADLTVNQLKNGKYLVPSWENPDQGEWVQLKNGEFARRNQDNPLFVNLVKVALGPLTKNQTQDAAVIYGYNTGGSGFFMVLCAVINDQGQPKNSAITDLGDRVKINSLSIHAGEIIIGMVTHGPDDPSCCPTVKKIATYTLVGNKLVEK